MSRAIRTNGCTTKRPGEMAELIENLTRGSDSLGRKGFDAPESPVFRRRHRGIAEDWESGRAEGCLSVPEGASGWTIAKRRNIERAHYESWCQCADVVLQFPESPAPSFCVCRKFRISGSPRCCGAPAEIARPGVEWREVFADAPRAIPERGEWFC